MKRAMVLFLVLAVAMTVGGRLAFAAADNSQETEQMMLNLDYDVYTMESQSYEEKTIATDESMILLYSSEGYGIAASLDSGEVLILRFDPDSSTVDAAGQTGTFSIEGREIAITDEDGWTAVFKQYESGLERLFIGLLLQSTAE